VTANNLNLTKDFKSKIELAENVAFFTGAGISAESGIPVFRGKDGIWNKLKPEELANFDAFLKNPQIVTEWYGHRRNIVRNSKPNSAHLTIAEMQNYFSNVTVITQNVDNLHKRAGSEIIYELHGNIERNYCIRCGKFYNEQIPFENKIPKCSCGGLIRPDVVWFGEFLPKEQFELSEIAAQESDIFFIVGTSAIVYPAANLIYVAKQYGAFLIEINVERTEISSLVNKSYFEKAGTVLPKILEEIKEIRAI